MTNQEKIKYILRSHPQTKFNRAEFMWQYIKQFYEVRLCLTEEKFKQFWREEAGLERALRDVLKEPEFRLKPEQDQRRYEKAQTFQQTFKKVA